MKPFECPICHPNQTRYSYSCHHILGDGYRVVYWFYINSANDTEIWNNDTLVANLDGLIYLDSERVKKLLVLI